MRIPDLSLPDISGRRVNLSTFAHNRPLLVIFSANHCPYVKHLEQALGMFAEDVGTESLKILAISPNDTAAYPADDEAGLSAQAERANWNFPYLIDTEQAAARAFDAVCTPDFFLFNADGELVYRGAFDNSSPVNDEPNDGSLMREAVEALLSSEPIPPARKAAMGCSIKWKTS